MTNPHKDKIYEFFSTPENFETMVKVSKRVDEVSHRVIQEFWDEVIKELKKTFREKDSDWVVNFSDVYKAQYCKVQLYRKSWVYNDKRVIGFAIQSIHYGDQPFIGTVIDANCKAFDVENIQNETNKIEHPSLYKLKPKGPWWSKTRSLPFGFGQYEDLQHILPSNRDNALATVVNEFVVLVENLEKDVERILNANRKNK
jgi:hypothetical protein